MNERDLAHKMEELALSKLKDSKLVSIQEYRKLQAKLTKGSILIAHEAAEDFSKVAKEIKSQGFHLHESTSSVELIDYLSKNWIDLIIFDFSIKWLDGKELAHWIREEDKIKNIPIIFMSDSSGKEVIKEAFNAGATDYLARPIDPIKLIKTVDTLLELNF